MNPSDKPTAGFGSLPILSGAPTAERAAPGVEIDPVCGMKVDPARAAATVDHAGHRYLFCSRGCAEKFQREPEHYLKAAGGSGGHEAPPPPKASPAAASYVCPMHPEVVRDRPGACPICGMALEPQSVTTADEVNPELVAMRRRFWASAALSIPLVLIALLEHDCRSSARAARRPLGDGVDRVSVGHAGGDLGRLAVFRARLGVAGESQLEYVHADLDRRGRCLSLQRRGAPVSRGVSGGVPHGERPGCRLFRRRGDDHDAGAVGAGLGTPRSRPNRRRASKRCCRWPRKRPGSFATTARKSMFRWTTCSMGIACACVPARKCRSMARSSKAQAPSMNRWSPASRFRSKNAAGDRVIGGTVNGTGGFVMRAEKVGSETLLAQIVEMVAAAQRSRARSSGWPTSWPGISFRRSCSRRS